jgi:hypothetical protein
MKNFKIEHHDNNKSKTEKQAESTHEAENETVTISSNKI